MIINIRGTSGSGKSTLVRRVMELYNSKTEWRDESMLPERKRPLGYVLTRNDDGRPLFVPGHYETACGGCDTIAESQFENVYMLVRQFATAGHDVLYEGLLLSAESARAIKLHQDGLGPIMVVALSTPLEVCLDGIRARREAKSGLPAEAFADSVLKNATSKQKGTVSCMRKMEEAGIRTRWCSRDDAFNEVVRVLDL